MSENGKDQRVLKAQAFREAVANAAAHIEAFDLEQLYGPGIVNADDATQQLYTEQQRRVVRLIRGLDKRRQHA